MDLALSTPVDVWTSIFAFLDLIEFHRISVVCKKFRSIVADCSSRETLDFTNVKRNVEERLQFFLSKYKLGNITNVQLNECYKLNDSMLRSICGTWGKTLRSLNLKVMMRDFG